MSAIERAEEACAACATQTALSSTPCHAHLSRRSPHGGVTGNRGIRDGEARAVAVDASADGRATIRTEATVASKAAKAANASDPTHTNNAIGPSAIPASPTISPAPAVPARPSVSTGAGLGNISGDDRALNRQRADLRCINATPAGVPALAPIRTGVAISAIAPIAPIAGGPAIFGWVAIVSAGALGAIAAGATLVTDGAVAADCEISAQGRMD